MKVCPIQSREPWNKKRVPLWLDDVSRLKEVWHILQTLQFSIKLLRQMAFYI